MEFTGGSPDTFRAAALCLEWGATPRQLTVEDLMLTPITVIESSAKIGAAMDFFEHSGSDIILLTKQGQWVGVIDRNTVLKALKHNLADQSVELISSGKPQSISLESHISKARERLSKSHLPVIIATKSNRAVGILDREALCLSTAPTSLPKDWESKIKAQLKWLEAVGKSAEQSGSNAYLVGGSVRDILIGEEPRDLDFTIVGDTIRTAKRLQKEHGGELQTEPLFGAAHWTTQDGERFDLTTGRAERYEKPGALPSVSAAPLRIDLQRRDFTINMMALNVTPARWGELIDPYGGAADLAQGQLRVISGLSFTDDPTRIFRAARYASRLGFAIHLDTADHLYKALNTDLGNSLSTSRLGRELELIFGDRHPQKAFSLLKQWGVLKHFWPREHHKIHKAFHEFEHALSRWKKLAIDPVAVGWILMGTCFSLDRREGLSQLASRSAGSLKKWLIQPKTLLEIANQLKISTPGVHGHWGNSFYDKPLETLVALDALHPEHREALTWWRDRGRTITSTVTGKELLSAGCPRGPLMGKSIRAAQLAAWAGEDEEGQLKAARYIWTSETT